MLFLRKAWSWLKTHWYWPVIGVILIVVFITTRKSPIALIEAFRKSRETHEKEVEAINRIHQEEIAKRDKALLMYQETISAIEKKYQEQNKALETKQKKEIEKLIKENIDDPTELTKRIAQVTGFEVVLPTE